MNPIDWEKYTVTCDPFDIRAFRDVFKESEKLQETLDPKRLATAVELGQDVFDSLYKYVPQLKANQEVDPAYEFNRSLIEKAMGTQEYQRLRSVTQLHDTESAIATEVISEELLKSLPEEDRQAVNDYAQKSGNLQNALDKLRALEAMKKLSPKNQKAQAGLQQQMPGLQQAVQQAQKAFNAACQNPALKAAFRQAVNAALGELTLAGDFAGGWGLDPGQLSKVPAKERMELMKLIVRSTKIKELSKLLGRFKRLAFQKRYTRPTMEPTEVVDVTIGDDLAHILPSELALLGSPMLRGLFYKKYVEKDLLQYELRGRETFGRGPIIILIDNSGSMGAGIEDVTREMWAKAMGLAMAEIALKDKRTIEFINFGSRGEIHKVVIEHTLPPAERVRRMIEAAETNFGGGTDFERPLQEAVDDVDRQAFKKADVIMVTDGQCDVSEEFEERFKEVKEKKAFRLHSVIIGGTDETLVRLSDTVHNLYDLLSQGDAVAGNLFESV